MGYLTPPPAPAPVIVHKDVGGLVRDYQAQTEEYRREGREVRLHECRSACTMALSLPNVCVYPDSVLKFHQAYNAFNHEPDLSVSAELFSSYPAAVQSRLGYLTRRYTVLSGAELIALGVRSCNGDNRILIAQPKAPAPPSAPARSDPLKEIAQTVEGAVAKAIERLDDSKEPIRVAVADRKPLPPTRPAEQLPLPPASGGTKPVPASGDARVVARYEDAQPPRRPAETFAIANAGAVAYLRLMPGAQPIMGDKSFTPFAAPQIN